MVDVEPIKFVHTWKNMRIGDVRDEKMLDRILVSKSIMDDPKRIRSCVEVGGESGHLPIMFYIAKEDRKPPSPFKFNSTWLEDEEILNLVKEKWKSFDDTLRVSTSLHSISN